MEKAEEPRDNAAAAESEDEHEQDRRHRGVEPLERELQQPGQRARRQADRSEHRDPDGRTERRRSSSQEDRDEQLERQKRVVARGVGDRRKLHRKRSGEPGNRGGDREGP